MKACESYYVSEQQHSWRGQDYTIPATGTLKVFKPEGFHREQVFSAAVVELRTLIEKMYPEDDASG